MWEVMEAFGSVLGEASADPTHGRGLDAGQPRGRAAIIE
jgi:hypothetical protein